MRKPSEYARLLDAELARLDSPDAIGLALAHLRGTLYLDAADDACRSPVKRDVLSRLNQFWCEILGRSRAHIFPKEVYGPLFMERFSEELVVGKRRFVPWSEFPKALRRAAKITGTLEEQA